MLLIYGKLATNPPCLMKRSINNYAGRCPAKQQKTKQHAIEYVYRKGPKKKLDSIGI